MTCLELYRYDACNLWQSLAIYLFLILFFDKQTQFKDLLLTLKHSMDEIWVIEMLSAGKYPETEEEMEMYNISMTTASRMSYDLIKPEQRYKPKMNIIEFEMDLFRDHAKKIIKF